MYPAWLPARYL